MGQNSFRDKTRSSFLQAGLVYHKIFRSATPEGWGGCQTLQLSARRGGRYNEGQTGAPGRAHLTRGESLMTIHPIQGAGVALYITPAELETRGLTARELSAVQAGALARQVCAAVGLLPEG